VFAQSITSEYFTMNLCDWNLVDKKATRYTPESFINNSDYYYDEISKYLLNYNERKSGKKIQVHIINGGINATEARGDAVYIGFDFINNNYSVMPHEITHLLLSSDSVSSYSEGLADCIQTMFSNESMNNWYYSGNVHAKLKVVWGFDYDETRIKSVVDGYDTIDIWSKLESQSLVQYIIDKYGIDKLCEYIKYGGYKSTDEIFMISEEKLMAEWIEYVKQIEDDNNWSSNIEKIKALKNSDR